MKNKYKSNKKENGITLIALVITIIVLLILAGVTITTLTGDNGVLEKTKKAKIQTEIAGIKEQIQADIFDRQVEGNGNISDDSLEEILLSYGTLSEEEKITDRTLTTTKENYEIKVSDIWNGITKEDEPTFTTVANAPDTIGFNSSNTYYVAWDLTSSPYAINESTAISGTAPSNWYDYTAGVNHWANIKTTGGGNDCYWVWIPRYAYCITTGYQSNTAGTIDIKFLQGTTNTPIDGSSITISNSSGSGNWNVHPAFWWDKDNDGVEDEGEQLTGIWVAKYEASSSNVGTINLENGTLTGDTDSLSGTGGGTGEGTDTSLQVRVKPNVTSWRGLNVNGIFTVCQNLTTSGNSLQGTSGLDSHMMKNTEWGACAYLSSSIYGKTDTNGNRERIYNNPYYNDTTNYSPITGLAGATATQTNNATTTNLYIYNTQEGVEASTTGNVYGIYDMVGGAWEYVAGILSSYKSNSGKYDFTNSDTYPNKYFDWYAGNSSDRNTNYNANTNKYGDAVYETSSSGNSNTGSWDSSISDFPNSGNPVFLRGGHAYHGSYAGVFAFDEHTGGANASYSFRPVVLSSQP